MTHDTRAKLLRCHGILAPHAKRREAVVPKKPDEEELRKTRGLSKNRILWAALLARTFNLKMETCPDCGGRMRIVAAVTDPLSVKTYLDGVGLESEIPKLTPPRAPPQIELDMGYGA
jgi:hypothetical protein